MRLNFVANSIIDSNSCFIYFMIAWIPCSLVVLIVLAVVALFIACLYVNSLIVVAGLLVADYSIVMEFCSFPTTCCMWSPQLANRRLAFSPLVFWHILPVRCPCFNRVRISTTSRLKLLALVSPFLLYSSHFSATYSLAGRL